MDIEQLSVRHICIQTDGQMDSYQLDRYAARRTSFFSSLLSLVSKEVVTSFFLCSMYYALGFVYYALSSVFCALQCRVLCRCWLDGLFMICCALNFVFAIRILSMYSYCIYVFLCCVLGIVDCAVCTVYSTVLYYHIVF